MDRRQIRRSNPSFHTNFYRVNAKFSTLRRSPVTGPNKAKNGVHLAFEFGQLKILLGTFSLNRSEQADRSRHFVEI